MSPCTTTVPNSVRNSAPVGQTSRHPACVQCLHTSELISQRICLSAPDCPVCGSNSLSASALSTLDCCAVARLSSFGPSVTDRPASRRSSPGRPNVGIGRSTVRLCSMNATCRQLLAPSCPVLSYDIPDSPMTSRVPCESSIGRRFHSLHATSQALQPMHTEVSVKKPTRAGWSPSYPASPWTSGSGPNSRLSGDRKSTRLNSSHANISYAVFCLKKKSTFRTPAEAQPVDQARRQRALSPELLRPRCLVRPAP